MTQTKASQLLLIEDDQYTRELYEEILKEAGYQVTTASDGETGLNLINSKSFDLILLDVMLPKIDGLNVLKQAQEAAKPERKPIIVMTNMANISILQEATTMGALNTLIKSDMNPDKFLKLVKDHLQELKDKR